MFKGALRTMKGEWKYLAMTAALKLRLREFLVRILIALDIVVDKKKELREKVGPVYIIYVWGPYYVIVMARPLF